MGNAKRMAAWLVLGMIFFCSPPASPGAAPMLAELRYTPPPAAQKKNARELVIRLRNASVGELQNLTFLELNLLKNAVFASKGYKFADDRPWLKEVFCGGPQKKPVKKKAAKRALDEKTPGEGVAAGGPSPGPSNDPWDLSAYAFPACRDSGPLDEDQKKAIANVRVATIKKLEAIPGISEVDNVLNREVTPGAPQKGPVWILGKEISFPSLLQFGYVSMRRDLHGMNRMLNIMRNLEAFDSMELLGLFAGDIMFLKNVIEAKQGKPFSGVVGWEISQIIGITEQKQGYDPAKLPPDVQARLRSLDEIVTRIMRSDLNDIPASLKSRPVEFSDPYDFEGC